MNSDRIPFALLLLSGLLSGTSILAQPLCEVLLNPAFGYSTYGLAIQVEDSSRTFGIDANRTWDFGDGSGTTADVLHYFQVPGIYDVCLTLTALELPCTVTHCRSVVVRASDCSVPVNAHFDWVPAGTNTAAFHDASAPFNATNILWDFGDGVTDQTSSPTHTWFLPGAHFVSLTKWNDSCATSHGEWVGVDGNTTTCAPPGLFLDFEPIYTGSGVEFVPEIVVNNVIPAFYIWSYGDGVIDTTVVGHHEYAGAGPFQVCCLLGAVTTYPELDSCFALTCRTTQPYAGTYVSEVVDERLSVAPNPFVESLRIELGWDAGATSIRLMDMLGRMALESTVHGAEVVVLDTQKLPPGPYLLMISGGTKVQRTKVIKASN